MSEFDPASLQANPRTTAGFVVSMLAGGVLMAGHTPGIADGPPLAKLFDRAVVYYADFGPDGHTVPVSEQRRRDLEQTLGEAAAMLHNNFGQLTADFTIRPAAADLVVSEGAGFDLATACNPDAKKLFSKRLHELVTEQFGASPANEVQIIVTEPDESLKCPGAGPTNTNLSPAEAQFNGNQMTILDARKVDGQDPESEISTALHEFGHMIGALRHNKMVIGARTGDVLSITHAATVVPYGDKTTIMGDSNIWSDPDPFHAIELRRLGLLDDTQFKVTRSDKVVELHAVDHHTDGLQAVLVPLARPEMLGSEMAASHLLFEYSYSTDGTMGDRVLKAYLVDDRWPALREGAEACLIASGKDDYGMLPGDHLILKLPGQTLRLNVEAGTSDTSVFFSIQNEIDIPTFAN